jgi:hypothetical protein
MKNIMKTLIFSILVIFMTIGITSCGDKENDPTPQYSLEDFLGTWKSTSVVYDGKTFTDPCDKNWPTAVKSLRKIDLKFKSGVVNQTDILNYSCSASNVLNDMATTLSNNILDIDGYIFKVLSYDGTILTLELTSTVANTNPIGGVYKLKRN